MRGRLKQLRLSFGLDQRAMTEMIGCALEQLAAWEGGAAPLGAVDLARIAGRFGVSAEWLAGHDVPIWGARLLELREWLGKHIQELSGPRLVEMLTATTGERIAYVMNTLRRMDPTLMTVPCIACWLGLSVGSTELLLHNSLDPGSPVVARASDLTGIPEHWFRAGPVEQLAQENEKGDLE